jgi:hypothetical protein
MDVTTPLALVSIVPRTEVSELVIASSEESEPSPPALATADPLPPTPPPAEPDVPIDDSNELTLPSACWRTLDKTAVDPEVSEDNGLETLDWIDWMSLRTLLSEVCTLEAKLAAAADPLDAAAETTLAGIDTVLERVPLSADDKSELKACTSCWVALTTSVGRLLAALTAAVIAFKLETPSVTAELTPMVTVLRSGTAVFDSTLPAIPAA